MFQGKKIMPDFKHDMNCHISSKNTIFEAFSYHKGYLKKCWQYFPLSLLSYFDFFLPVMTVVFCSMLIIYNGDYK